MAHVGKHSFYALWLAFLNLLHVNIVVGGQALFAVSCLVLLAALKPVMRTNWGRLFVFAVTLYTPGLLGGKYAARLPRQYLSLPGAAGAGRTIGRIHALWEKPLRALPIMLPPAFPLRRPGCATRTTRCCCRSFCARRRFILLICFWTKALRTKKSRLALLLVPLALWGGGIAAWCGMNYKYYGRFIISDFTSSEFNDAMGALSRAYPDDQKRYELIPLSTRLALYEVSPTFAKLQDVLETPRCTTATATRKQAS